jgi:hypothetical protein
MTMKSGAPNLKNTFFDPYAKQKHGLINLFFSNAVLSSKMPYFAWDGKVYKVEIPACGCLGKSTYTPTNALYSQLKNE